MDVTPRLHSSNARPVKVNHGSTCSTLITCKPSLSGFFFFKERNVLSHSQCQNISTVLDLHFHTSWCKLKSNRNFCISLSKSGNGQHGTIYSMQCMLIITARICCTDTHLREGNFLPIPLDLCVNTTLTFTGSNQIYICIFIIFTHVNKCSDEFWH